MAGKRMSFWRDIGPCGQRQGFWHSYNNDREKQNEKKDGTTTGELLWLQVNTMFTNSQNSSSFVA